MEAALKWWSGASVQTSKQGRGKPTELAPEALMRVLSYLTFHPSLGKNDYKRPGAPSGDIQDRLPSDTTVQKALGHLDNISPGSLQADVWMQLI
jgi:hypothetical protein